MGLLTGSRNSYDELAPKQCGEKEKHMKGFALAAAVLLLLAGGNAIAQQTDESYFNEAVENSDGSASGKLNVLRSEGQLPSMLYHIENDGYFQVFDEQSEQMVSHGIISSDGKVESKPPGKHVLADLQLEEHLGSVLWGKQLG